MESRDAAWDHYARASSNGVETTDAFEHARAWAESQDDHAFIMDHGEIRKCKCGGCRAWPAELARAVDVK